MSVNRRRALNRFQSLIRLIKQALATCIRTQTTTVKHNIKGHGQSRKTVVSAGNSTSSTALGFNISRDVLLNDFLVYTLYD